MTRSLGRTICLPFVEGVSSVSAEVKRFFKFSNMGKSSGQRTCILQFTGNITSCIFCFVLISSREKTQASARTMHITAIM